MDAESIVGCVALVRRSGSATLIEVSGGVTLTTAPRLAVAGVDLLSVGALTHSAPVLDLGLDLVPAPTGGE
jgi:nicotinate-nucleotide pyrophosphorylase (carboxylating)